MKHKLEQRQKERLPVRQFENTDFPGNPEYRIINISNSGCHVEAQEPLGPVDTTISFDLPLPGKAGALNLDAQIVWEEQVTDGEETLSRYGLLFKPMNKETRMIMVAYMDFLKRDLNISKLEKVRRKLVDAQEKMAWITAMEMVKRTGKKMAT